MNLTDHIELVIERVCLRAIKHGIKEVNLSAYLFGLMVKDFNIKDLPFKLSKDKSIGSQTIILIALGEHIKISKRGWSDQMVEEVLFEMFASAREELKESIFSKAERYEENYMV